MITHELGVRFHSPTVNLWFDPADYLKLLKNLNYYLFQCELKEDCEKEKSCGYPVGKLGDVTIYFTHYTDFYEAKKKWLERCKRVNFQNMYLIMVERDGCTGEQVKEFALLPYQHKVIFTSQEYPEIACAYHIQGANESDCRVRNLCAYKGRFTGKRWIDDFDYVNFLNIR